MLNLALLYKIVSVLRHEDSFIPIANLVMDYTIDKDNYEKLLAEIAKANGETEYEVVDILELDIMGVKFKITPE